MSGGKGDQEPVAAGISNKVVNIEEESKKIQRLYPSVGQSLPSFVQWFLYGPFAFVTVSLFCFIFYIVPILLLYSIFQMLFGDFLVGASILAVLLFLSFWPREHHSQGKSTDSVYSSEWPEFRKYFSIWFNHFSLSHTVQPLPCFDPEKRYLVYAAPHGVVPLTALLWSAYFDHFWRINYGCLGVAPIVLRIPVLRQIALWLSTCDARYETLVKLMTKRNRSLIILPGGIAEIFLATPKKESIYLQNRKGFVKLAIETGAELVPVYFFGVAGMFDQTTQSHGWLARMSRKLRGSLTLFWGRWFLPIPYPTKVTIAVGKHIPVTKKLDPSQEEIDALHAKCIQHMRETFEEYKHAAGYSDKELEIM